MSSDRALLDAWMAGDAAAGEELVERHWAAISRFFRTKAADDAGDLIASTFLALVEGKERVEGGDIRAYLFAIARRRLVDHVRARSRQNEFDPANTSLAAAGPGPASQLVAEQRARLLHEALARLPLDDQLALELSYIEELSGREIAVVLAIGEHTVRSRLARAKDKLRAILAELAGPDEAARAEAQLGPRRG